ncbi:MAG: hypothetical protein JJT96_04720 [Opitutales bacterium]|nr:hypothetical protein [Opitutales bacterium]
MSFANAARKTLGDPGFWLRLGTSGLALGWSVWLFGKLGTQMGAWALFHGGVAHAQIGAAERVLAWTLLVLAAVAWLPKRWGGLAAIAGLLVLIEAVVGTINGGYAFSQWSVPTRTLRILLPVILLVWVFRAQLARAETVCEWLLRGGIALVFATHGLEAFFGHPAFQDYLIGTAEVVFGLEWVESDIQVLLWGIALLDGVVAVLVLFVSWRGLFAWLAFWGFITALARLTTYGMPAYPELLLRFPHFCAPLALWALARAKR